jgi:hypothetical protein
MPQEAFQVARSAGYQAVCSAYGGYNFPGDDSFHLRRIHADNEMIRLRNWLTLDPRKTNSAHRSTATRTPLRLPATETEMTKSGSC